MSYEFPAASYDEWKTRSPDDERSDRCEGEGCSECGVGFNDDGQWLCEDCMADWAYDAFDDDEE